MIEDRLRDAMRAHTENVPVTPPPWDQIEQRAAIARRARRQRFTMLGGLAAAAAVLVGLGGLVLVLGGNPFAARLLLAYVLSGGVAFARASGAWG